MSARPEGVLRVQPGHLCPLVCERPIAQPRVFDALVRGRDAFALPALFAGLFTLCADMHRITAARAVDTALGRPASPERLAHEAALVRAACLREHLTRLALDLPVRAPMQGIPLDARWLRALPAAPRGLHSAAAQEVEAHAGALAEFAAVHLLGGAPGALSARFDAHPRALADWASEQAERHPAAAWLVRAEPLARALPISLTALPLAAEPDTGAAWLAAALVADPELALHPHWHGEAVASGPFSRARGVFRVETLWDVLAARIRDVAALCSPAPWLTLGAVAIAQDEALAYTEMARGLLVHWVRLERGTSTVAAYRVLSPTDWTFHAHGALATALRERVPGDLARLAVAAFDPCVEAVFL